MNEFHKYILVPIDHYKRLEKHLPDKADTIEKKIKESVEPTPEKTKDLQNKSQLDPALNDSVEAPPPGLPRDTEVKSIHWYTLM